MILSKDNNTLNLTTSILSAKSMLQSKLDGIGIDVRTIEGHLNTLQSELVQLKADVEETKEELITTAEELKDKTDNDKIKHLIDEVQTTLDGVEINDDILGGLCLSDFIPEPVCGNVDEVIDSCSRCHGYTYNDDVGCRPVYHTCIEIHDTGCYGDWDSYCPSCYENGFDENCGQKFEDCTGGYCHAGFSDTSSDGNDRDCPTEFNNDCINRHVTSIGGSDTIACILKYVSPGIKCDEGYEEGENDVLCTVGYDEYGTTCNQDHYRSDEYSSCYGGYTDPETGEHCNGVYNYMAGTDGGHLCSGGYGDGTIDCKSGYSVDSNGVVSCESGHSGSDGSSCEEGHTWQDDIGGSCDNIFHNSQMNCQGGVSVDVEKGNVACRGIYKEGSINCPGYGRQGNGDIQCIHNYVNPPVVCRHIYTVTNGEESCANNDPISCNGCVGGYCDYCGGCVGNCDSCRGCHGSSDCGSCDGSCVSSCDGNCWHESVTTCTPCVGRIIYGCGAPNCGGTYDSCAAGGDNPIWGD